MEFRFNLSDPIQQAAADEIYRLACQRRHTGEQYFPYWVPVTPHIVDIRITGLGSAFDRRPLVRMLAQAPATAGQVVSRPIEVPVDRLKGICTPDALNTGLTFVWDDTLRDATVGPDGPYRLYLVTPGVSPAAIETNERLIRERLAA